MDCYWIAMRLHGSFSPPKGAKVDASANPAAATEALAARRAAMQAMAAKRRRTLGNSPLFLPQAGIIARAI